MKPQSRAGAIAYWTLVVVLIAYGSLGLLSVGFPFLLLGITLAILSQRRHETGVIASGVSAVVGFVVGYILVAPLGCTTSGGAPGSISHTVCNNVVGIDYSGTGGYNPSLAPGVLAGLVVAVLFALAARWLARRMASRQDALPVTA